MNQQYLEYVRGALSVALVDIPRSGKGQLAAFEGAALARTSRFKRKRGRSVSVGGRRVCSDSEPMHCSETRTRRKPLPPIDPLSYCTSSWRRAFSILEPFQQAWLRYCYGRDLTYDYQVTMCRHIWRSFQKQLDDENVSSKVQSRMASLVWLAIQQTAGECSELHGHRYRHSELAGLAGVARDNWSKNYVKHWEGLLRYVESMDADSLGKIARIRIDRKQLLAT